jgi:two-component system, response regulator PdtaR
MAEQPDIRVLFTDIQMPGKLDGIQLARRVHEKWREVLLLITSGGRQPAKA